MAMFTCMTFGGSIAVCFRKYADFSGRACRAEYWWWVLFAALLQQVALLSDLMFGFGLDDNGPAGSIVGLGLFLPGFAVGFRRLHDINRSGWWVGLPLIVLLLPFVGLVIAAQAMGAELPGTPSPQQSVIGCGILLLVLPLLVWLVVLVVFSLQDGTAGPNKYGADPKGRQRTGRGSPPPIPS